MLGSSSSAVHSEIMPVNRTSFESLDKARLKNYLRDILKDSEVPETRKSWIVRLKALGFMTDGITEDPVCTIAGMNLFGIKPRQTLKQSGVNSCFSMLWARSIRRCLIKCLMRLWWVVFKWVTLENPDSDYQALAYKIRVSQATVKRHIQKLKRAGILLRKGSRKTGHWEVIG